MASYSAPNNKKVYVRMGIEIGAFVALAVLGSIKILEKEPHTRGFYCKDQGIDKPFIVDEQVPNMHCLFIWTGIAAVTLISVELFHGLVYCPMIYRDLKIHPIACELYRIIGSFVLGATFTMGITEMVKVTIGEFRPHFLSLCHMNKDSCNDTDWNSHFNFSTSCSNPSDFNLSYEEWAKKLIDARKSFLSGHSSFSFFSAVFLALYLKSRLSQLRTKERYMGNKRGLIWAEWILMGLKVLRPFLQFSYLALAFFIAMSRVSDYYHHPRDVISGGLLGTLGAYLTYTEIAQLDNKPRVFHSLNYKTNPMTNLEMEDIYRNKKALSKTAVSETDPLNQERELNETSNDHQITVV